MCKGTTNWESVYLIPIEVIPKDTLAVIDRGWVTSHKGVPVDKCIGKEVEELIKEGVLTCGSCCGHGQWSSHVLVHKEQNQLLKKLGYDVYDYKGHLDIIKLKTGTDMGSVENL